MTRSLHSLSTLALLGSISLAGACTHQASMISSQTTTLASVHDTRDDMVATVDSQPRTPAQLEAAHDAAITARLRRRVLADSTLSFAARRCEIQTRHGFVIIRGYATRSERDAISAHAQRTVATPYIDNELQVLDAPR